MIRTLTRSPLAGALALAILFAGCSDDTNPIDAGPDELDGTESIETADLDAAYGNIAFTDEAEAFGDDELLTAADLDDAAALSEDDEDSLTDDDPSLGGPNVRRTYVRILWGQLDGRFDPATERPEIEPVDWSGSIKVTEGAVALKRTILFERRTDHRLPRASRDSVAWKSFPGPHYDGVLVCLITPVEDGAVSGEMIFETPQFSTTLAIDLLDGFHETTVVDDLGNAVSIRAAVREPQGCAAGFVAGFWKGIEDRPETDAIEMGFFRGRYVGQAGLTNGFLKGLYGMTSEGERVMVGKYVSRNGRVMGLIRGTWTSDESGDGMGTFQAHWVNRRGTRAGELFGSYYANGEDEIGDGFFEGRYQENCSDAS